MVIVIPKPKRRNSEKRKERSRDAARCRRSKETEVFYQLSHELPIADGLLAQLDKASIIRLAITHLKLRKLLMKADIESSATVRAFEEKLDQQYYKALDGFVMVLGKDGDIMYISRNVDHYLGIAKVEMLGQSIFEFAHPCDHEEIRDIVGGKAHGTDSDAHRVFFLRMKCTLTSKGRNINLKSASYRVIHYYGSVMHRTLDHQLDDNCVVLTGCPVLHPSTVEIPLDSHMFVSRHSMDMRFTYCDDGIQELVGYKPADMIGRLLYEYHHTFDMELVEKAFKTLFAKGQSVLGLHRFLANGGGYVWMETQATVINNPRNDKAQFVICINNVVSGVECGELVMAEFQQPSITETEEELKEEEAELIAFDIDDEEEKEELDDNFTFVTEKLLGLAAKCIEIAPQLQDGMDEINMCTLNAAPTSIENQLVYMTGESGDDVMDPEVGSSSMTGMDSTVSLTTLLNELDENFDTRAPYIPMDESDDLPVIFTSGSSAPTKTALIQEPTIDSNVMDLSNPLTVVISSQLDLDLMNTFFTTATPFHNIPTHGRHVLDELMDPGGRIKPSINTPGILTVSPPPNKVAKFFTNAGGVVILKERDDDEFDEEPSGPDFKDEEVPPVEKASNSSVLMNLLLNGEDVNYGYRIGRPPPPNQVTNAQQPAKQSGFTSVLHQLLTGSQADLAAMPGGGGAFKLGGANKGGGVDRGGGGASNVERTAHLQPQLQIIRQRQPIM